MRDRPAGRHGSVHPLRFAALRSGEARPTPEDCGTCNLRATQSSDALFASRTTQPSPRSLYAPLFHSKSIHPRDSSSVIFASARREPRGISARPSITRIPPLLILHNTTTELGGKTLSVFSTCVQPFYGMVGGVGRR